ncbi:MAG: LysR substrate-binding domain-containing protein [Pseudomonadota bacterium]
MREPNIGDLDLNLLKVFQALSAEGSVTRAAERLGIGQPAVSQALGRLREALGDELFVRAAEGMQPTPRAALLLGPIADALRQIESVIYSEPIGEAADTGPRFTIGATDFVAAALVPELLRRLGLELPGASVALVHADKHSAPQMLLDLQIDVAVGFFPEAPRWIQRRPLFAERHVCVFNPELVSAPVPITLEDYVRYQHVLVSPTGRPEGFVDEMLLRQGRRREVVLTTPYFLLVSHLLSERPLIATLPSRYAEKCAGLAKLVVSRLPFEAPEFDISLLWRTSDHRSPRQEALRRMIDESTR